MTLLQSHILFLLDYCKNIFTRLPALLHKVTTMITWQWKYVYWLNDVLFVLFSKKPKLLHITFNFLWDIVPWLIIPVYVFSPFLHLNTLHLQFLHTPALELYTIMFRFPLHPGYSSLHLLTGLDNGNVSFNCWIWCHCSGLQFSTPSSATGRN